MSTKTIIAAVIVVLILGVGALAFMNKQTTPASIQGGQTTASDTSTAQVVQTTTTTTSGSASVSNNKDASDASLAKDMTSVDTQMNGLNSDSASADQGLSATN